LQNFNKGKNAQRWDELENGGCGKYYSAKVFLADQRTVGTSFGINPCNKDITCFGENEEKITLLSEHLFGALRSP
jgi:hypothetical protein